MKNLLWGCGVWLAGACAVHAQEAKPQPTVAAIREVMDLSYVKDGQEPQRLNLYLPAETAAGATAPKPWPLVAYVHGGGWETGSRKGGFAKVLVYRGYAVASIGYRLSSQAIFPAQIEDCKAAVRWLRAHAGEYGIDPARIGVWGDSAGGHLVSLLGTTGGTHAFEVGENLDQPDKVQCVLDWYGPADFLNWGDPLSAAIFVDLPNTSVARLLGGSVTARRDLARAASPVYSVNRDSAPFLIMHGDKDPTVPVQQSEELDAALHKAGVESTLKILPGAGHGGPAFSSPDSVQIIADFLDRHLHPVVLPAPGR